jgi:hypothetical protein
LQKAGNRFEASSICDLIQALIFQMPSSPP